jgi:large subunit ribosomal protein L1
VKEGVIDFDRCICHTDSLQKLNKAGLGRVLGPKGLMPSAKTGTVVNNIGSTVRDMVGGSEYRERVGVVRMAIGQLGFTPEAMQNNIKAFMDAIKKDIGQMSDRITKEIHEVVRSLVQVDFILANVATGDQLYKFARLHTKRRIQRT